MQRDRQADRQTDRQTDKLTDRWVYTDRQKHNAHTDTETTVFWFESPRRHFHEGMDRFAQFFISPLMKEEAMQRVADTAHREGLSINTELICLCSTSEWDTTLASSNVTEGNNPTFLNTQHEIFLFSKNVKCIKRISFLCLKIKMDTKTNR